jgi:hypothetical protein
MKYTGKQLAQLVQVTTTGASLRAMAFALARLVPSMFQSLTGEKAQTKPMQKAESFFGFIFFSFP